MSVSCVSGLPPASLIQCFLAPPGGAFLLCTGGRHAHHTGHTGHTGRVLYRTVLYRNAGVSLGLDG